MKHASNSPEGHASFQFNSSISFLSRNQGRRGKSRHVPSLSYSYAANKGGTNSLDYTSILPVFRPGKGIAISWGRRQIHTGISSPGPGHYNINRRFEKSKIGIDFGKSRKDLLTPIEKTDYRGYHYDLFDEDSKKSRLTGYSFSKVAKGHSLVGNLNVSVPGPGHYSLNTEAVKPRAESFMFSLTGIFPEKKVEVETNNFADTFSKLQTPKMQTREKGSNFQMFSLCKRFPDTRTKVFRILRRDAGTRQEIIMKNKEEVSESRKCHKLQRIYENKQKLTQKIRLTQETKEKLAELHVSSLLEKSMELDRKRLLRKEKANTWKIASSWTFLGAVLNILRMMSKKYYLRKAVCTRTTKFLKVLYVCFWSVGKFIIKLKNIRHRHLVKVMNGIVKAKAGLWKIQRRVRSKKRIITFVNKFEDIARLPILIKEVTYRIQILKRWFVRMIAWKRFMLAIANYEWSLLEELVIQAKGRKIPAKDIEECVKSQRVTDIVPLSIRLIYIKSLLRVLNRENYAERKVYWKKVRKLREKAIEEHELRNVERYLKGLKKEEFVFKPPKPPVLKALIRIWWKSGRKIGKEKMVVLIRKALDDRLEWDKIRAKGEVNLEI